MEYIMIKNDSNIIFNKFVNETYKHHEELLTKTVHGFSHISKQFINTEFKSYSINGYSVLFHRTVTDTEFIIVTKNNDNKLMQQILKAYAGYKLYNDIKVLEAVVLKFFD